MCQRDNNPTIQQTTSEEFHMLKLKSSFHKFLRTPSRSGCPLQINRYTVEIGYVSYFVVTIPSPFHECDLPNQIIYRVCSVFSFLCVLLYFYCVLLYFCLSFSFKPWRCQFIPIYKYDCSFGIFCPSFKIFVIYLSDFSVYFWCFPSFWVQVPNWCLLLSLY